MINIQLKSKQERSLYLCEIMWVYSCSVVVEKMTTNLGILANFRPYNKYFQIIKISRILKINKNRLELFCQKQMFIIGILIN